MSDNAAPKRPGYARVSTVGHTLEARLDQLRTAGCSRGFREFAIDEFTLKPGRCGIARRCTDWTGRKPRIAGSLGTAFLNARREKGWMRRAREGRSVFVTPKGHEELRRHRGIDLSSLARVESASALA